MRLVVFSHKQCWPAADSPSQYATDGGFPFQMAALSELFDATVLVVPCSKPRSCEGEIALKGHNLSIAPLSMPMGRGLARKLSFGFWVLRNSPLILRELFRADAVHAPIPGDIGTIGMLLAFIVRKPLFVRHCGNWLAPVTRAEYFWKWFMEMFAGGKQVMLATGGSPEPPSRRNAALRWIFATSLGEDELRSCKRDQELKSLDSAKLIIVCRQEREKGTGVTIQSLPLILKTFPEASLDVVGDGHALEEFRNIAKNLGVSDRVTFHGKVDHNGVIRLLRQANLFCYPTRASEGFPKVVLEALACGLPVITTRVSVLPELIGAGGGALIDEATPEAVAESVIRILSDRDRYRSMSTLAIETARRFSLEHWRDTIGEQLRSAWGELRAKKSMVDLKDLSVCFVVGTLGRGGAERQLIYMLKALKSAGVKTRVLCLTRGEALEEEIRQLEVPVIWVGTSRWRPIRLFRILQELRHEPPHIIQSAHFYTNLYAAVAARLLGIKSIGAIRSDLTSELNCSGIMGWGQLHLPRQLITNSKLARQRAINKGINPEQIDAVPNVVDLTGSSKQFNGASKSNGNGNGSGTGKGNGSGNGAVRILFAGRLTEQKRVDRFLRTLQMIAQSRPDLNFTAKIAGDGPQRRGLEQLASQLGLGRNQVEFLGELNDVRPIYYRSDFLMLTSDFEGTPNVLLEAMACGLPVVVTRAGGVPEIIGADCGLMVEPDDEDGLTAATLRMLEDRNLRTALGHQAKEYVARFHSLNALKKQLTDIYTRILSA